MKIDMDLIRDLLLIIQEDEGDILPRLPKSVNRQRAIAHLELTEQVGFTNNHVRCDGEEVIEITMKLTDDGLEFVESIKEEKVWNHTKQYFMEKGFHFNIWE